MTGPCPQGYKDPLRYDVAVFNPREPAFVPHQRVVVRHGWISSVGTQGGTSSDDSTVFTIDGTGRFLIPWERWRSEDELDLDSFDNRLALLRKYQELTLLLHRRGLNLLAGADATNPFVVPGYSLHDELELLVGAGFTEAETLRAATLGAAEFLGIDTELETIEEGKVADMVLLSDNPLERIQNSRTVELVVRSGIVCDPENLIALVPA